MRRWVPKMLVFLLLLSGCKNVDDNTVLNQNQPSNLAIPDDVEMVTGLLENPNNTTVPDVDVIQTPVSTLIPEEYYIFMQEEYREYLLSLDEAHLSLEFIKMTGDFEATSYAYFYYLVGEITVEELVFADPRFSNIKDEDINVVIRSSGEIVGYAFDENNKGVQLEYMPYYKNVNSLNMAINFGNDLLYLKDFSDEAVILELAKFNNNKYGDILPSAYYNGLLNKDLKALGSLHPFGVCEWEGFYDRVFIKDEEGIIKFDPNGLFFLGKATAELRRIMFDADYTNEERVLLVYDAFVDNPDYTVAEKAQLVSNMISYMDGIIEDACYKDVKIDGKIIVDYINDMQTTTFEGVLEMREKDRALIAEARANYPTDPYMNTGF